MKTVVITGSREWADPEPIRSALRGADYAILGCARGADAIAREVCGAWDIPAEMHRARWRELGKLAGAERNGRMVRAAVELLARGFDVQCYAFPLPGSVGTYDCIRQLKAARFDVRVHLLDLQHPQRAVPIARTSERSR
jgi:hypothetical protein